MGEKEKCLTTPAIHTQPSPLLTPTKAQDQCCWILSATVDHIKCTLRVCLQQGFQGAELGKAGRGHVCMAVPTGCPTEQLFLAAEIF